VSNSDTFQIQSDSLGGEPYVLSTVDGEPGYVHFAWIPASTPDTGDKQNRTTFTFDGGNLKLAYKKTPESEEDWYAYSMNPNSASSDGPMFSPKSDVDLRTSIDGGSKITGYVDVATGEVKLKSLERQNLLHCWGHVIMSVGLGEDFAQDSYCTKMQSFAVLTHWVDPVVTHSA
jgi:hypothetical protein